MKKLLVMGLPGSGKTTLSKMLVESLDRSLWINADAVRAANNDWDFTYEGRMRQAERMNRIAVQSTEFDYCILDFVCPLPEMREVVSPDIVVWVDTIAFGRYEDTNRIFIPPTHYDYRIKSKSDEFSEVIASIMISHK